MNLNGPQNGVVKGNAKSSTFTSTHQNSGYNINGSFTIPSLPGIVAPGYQDVRFGYDTLGSPIPWSDRPAFIDGQSKRLLTNV